MQKSDLGNRTKVDIEIAYRYAKRFVLGTYPELYSEDRSSCRRDRSGAGDSCQCRAQVD